ncbi:DMT family transporter [Fluviispira multicolorata]|uniref:EamA-like transporter family protein n=1 Tax=Fluviispira multicolorata TaxID=2654512 RepID=A0A833N5X5_9BACT|nr:DMT family transporter [Fluviispira multicolorata]KAB8029034.1 EamA-like transporter family protein [Fluviispira multicolorata]
MKKFSIDWFLALFAGLLLTLMINYNSLLAKHSTPVIDSWIAHGIGTIAAFVFVICFSKLILKKVNHMKQDNLKTPLWAYLAGISGAFTVVLAAMTINSPLGLAASLALMLVGQVLYGIISDIFGLFGSSKKRFSITDFYVIISVLSGSGVIIYFR